jgi:hypothetical protein
MSLLISIMFLFIGAIISAAAFYDNFKKDSTITGYKIFLIVMFVLFLVFGGWDTVNKYREGNGAVKTVTDTVANATKTTNINIDSTRKIIGQKVDSTRKAVTDSMRKDNDRTVNILQGTIRDQTRALDSLGRLHAEKHLSPTEKMDILAKIQGIERENNLHNKIVVIMMLGNFNGPTFENELVDYLNFKGYTIKGNGSAPNVRGDGYQVLFIAGMPTILIGHFKL